MAGMGTTSSCWCLWGSDQYLSLVCCGRGQVLETPHRSHMVSVTQPSEGGPAREPVGDTVGKQGVKVLLAIGCSLLRWQNHHVLQ